MCLGERRKKSGKKKRTNLIGLLMKIISKN